MLQVKAIKVSFQQFLYEGSPQSSNKAPSYSRALELLGPILAEKAPAELRVEDIWAVNNPPFIRRLHEFVCEERKKGERGIFAGEEPRSYWEGGFMSAALASYLEFRVTHNHEERLTAEYERNKDLPPEEISRILQEQEVEDITQLVPSDADVDFESWEGKEVLRQRKERVGQRFFRQMILGTYESRCCLTGIAVPDLLIASHIVPWSEDVNNRLNPCNGLCLNALHDKAFDRGLISFDDDCRLLISDRIKEHVDNDTVNTNFAGFDGTALTPPVQHPPDTEFLVQHRNAWGF